MKNYYFLFSFLFVGSFACAQEKSEPVRQNVKLTPIKSSSSVPAPKAIQADSLAGETVEHLDAVIQAIDVKVAYVNGDAAEKEKALASGWYEQMAASRARLVARKQELLRRQNEEKKD